MSPKMEAVCPELTDCSLLSIQHKASLDVDKGESREGMELTSVEGVRKGGKCRALGYGRGPETASLSQVAEQNI